MASEVWLSLKTSERSLLREALNHYSSTKRAGKEEARAMLQKLDGAKPHPWVTIRVEGGLVDEITDNPFPVRLYDYDVDGVDEPEFDEDGRACVISEFEASVHHR